ncbi:MAG TPA: serine/threonine-protein kinase, partial [Burkholderiaceae bacterium]
MVHASDTLPLPGTLTGRLLDAPPAGDAPAEGDAAPSLGHVGRYTLRRRIGEGGLGTVWAAHDPLLSRLIAIKTLNVEVAADARERFDALFLNEARAAAGLSHPNIVTVYDAGVSDEGPYIAMELLQGRDLRQMRREGWRPVPEQAATIVRRVADALAYAHARGVVHRDIKPANIFMVGRTQPRVLDFGIARIAHQSDLLADDDGPAIGSPYYMAPEQLLRAKVDRRGDVFSLGVVLYELLTGVKPFTGQSLEEISAAVLQHRAPPAHEVDPAVPAGLALIAARAMEKRPEDRYPTARAMARALREWLDDREVAPAELAPAVDEPGTAPRWALPAVAAVALLAIFVAGWWTLAEPARDPAAVQTVDAGYAAATALARAVDDLDAADDGAAPAAAGAASTAPARAVAGRTDTRRTGHPAAAAPATGTVQLAVSPWGQIEVDGRPAGVAPPLTQLVLPEGAHTITVRNEAFAPRVFSVQVEAGQPIT